MVTAQQFPVLLIPSGGLHGLENDAVFRARLEEYARQGGVIAAFAQQHGYEYAALPGALPSPAGGGAGGEGFDGCFTAAPCRVVLIIVIYVSPSAPFPTA